MKKDILKLQKDINALMGKNTLMTASEHESFDGEVIPTGSIGLDIASGIGGVPAGRIVEIYGWESSGKTTVALQIIAEAQAAGGNCAFIDAEHAIDLIYAEALGVNVDELLINQPDNGERALELLEKLVRSGLMKVIVIDSVTALVPRAEIEGEMGDSKMGLHARLMSQAMRKLTAAIKKSNTCVIFLNQMRMKIGVMFGNPETTTGGNALKFYASMRIEVRKQEAPNFDDKKDRNSAHSSNITAKFVKNKCAPPFKIAKFEIEFGEGINRFLEIVEYGIHYKVIEQSGSWYSYKGEKIGQGKDAVIDLLANDDKLLIEIEDKIYKEAF